MLKTKTPPSPEVLGDLERLSRDYGINQELIASLKAGKEEARAHLKFFKTMTYATNGGVMFISLVIAGLGGQGLFNGFSIIALMSLILGAVLFVKFSAVFMGMQRSLRAAEAVARKHELI